MLILYRHLGTFNNNYYSSGTVAIGKIMHIHENYIIYINIYTDYKDSFCHEMKYTCIFSTL